MNLVGVLNDIQGKKIKIIRMTLSSTNACITMSWAIMCEKDFYSVSYYNVSRLRFTSISAPLEIEGFEIISHTKDGWDKGTKYEIHDFEEDCISFFCEKIDCEHTNIDQLFMNTH